MIYGKTEGIRNSILNELEKIYDINVPKYSVCTEEIIQIISRVTAEIEKEVSVAISRKGKVINVAIGDSTSVEVPLIDINERKLSGVRVIHTHPNGICRLSALDASALLKLKLDAIAAIAIDEGEIKDASLGFCTVQNDILLCEEYPHLSIDQTLNFNVLDKINYVEEIIKTSDVEEDDTEKAILVGSDTEESLKELKELADACDIPVLDTVFQKRNKVDTAFYIGKGKVFEIANLRQEKRANLIIFDDELSGSQVRNLESATGVKVIDRTTLILEIFARRAKTKEARIQVELAQLKYRSARLMGLGTVLSRTGGGIGTKGPGEKKLEIDRRKIREEILELQKELKKIRKTREVQRERRNKQNIPQVSLVGYTNAGKSTLRNTLCDIAAARDNQAKEKVFEANMLFATLDTTTRAITLPSNRGITLTDTVGFVQKLPHELVEAFKSTLEEVIYSDLLCHVVDASSDKCENQIEAVENVLEELGATDKPTLLVLNKIDLISEERLEELKEKYKERYEIVCISAFERINLDELLDKVEEKLPYTLVEKEYIIPYTEQQVVAYLHRASNILEEDYREEGTYIKAQVDDEVKNKCSKFELN
ncbi:GTPase HflX [Clostridium mediterraneense]|uniref:GTPase HflX n=1 Tax=Clostridium mediterraneense TaxID=1805472 RepID=UPI0008299649|nr:GTPase HflX [Clostridium mediterraneense]